MRREKTAARRVNLRDLWYYETMTNSSIHYCKAITFDGRELFVELTDPQMQGYTAPGSPAALIVCAYEDRDGEIIMHDDVFAEDLNIIMTEDGKVLVDGT
jgi:hypothetical protein